MLGLSVFVSTTGITRTLTEVQGRLDVRQDMGWHSANKQSSAPRGNMQSPSRPDRGSPTAVRGHCMGADGGQGVMYTENSLSNKYTVLFLHIVRNTHVCK